MKPVVSQKASKLSQELEGNTWSRMQNKRAVHVRALQRVHVRATTAVDTPTKVFPAFLPPEVQFLEEPAAREMAYRMQQVPVQTSLSQQPILTSTVVSKAGDGKPPVLLLHGFDSSLLEWRRLFPLLEAGGAQSYAVDILGWGFNNTEGVTSFGVEAKREHLYEFWKTYIKKPMVLVGASLGGSIAIDFAVTHPDAVAKLVLIDAQGFAEGVGNMATIPKFMAYAGIALLKSVPLRSYAFYLAFAKTTMSAIADGMRVGRLHCLVPGWADSSVNFMLSGGYNVASKIPEVQQETLVIWGEQDKILPREYAERFRKELPRPQLELVKDAGHIPHVEQPSVVADLILKFISTT
ncbi:hypothetical protein MPTK1_7g14470 [Marchantia polymorpha subsp. ruderalis]|nr:hypothetical protein MARPO_0009s0132 [Marchantia polymorpha]BBN17429.1 hypothetical protein Mp_7g14470 [Marchantia polymorpha subsp. ruderalis]|eukprot:PTQ47036.1 hypothetical protein MARPO_0009s0132 [Marchantia polymorpha]